MLSKALLALQLPSNTDSTMQSTGQEQHLRAQIELLQSHDQGHQSGLQNGEALSPQHHPRPLHPSSPPILSAAKSSEGSPPAQGTAFRKLAVKSDGQSHIHPELRMRRSAESDGDEMMSNTLQQGQSSTSPTSGPPGGHSGIPIAPALGVVPDDNVVDGRRAAKRELSQSKRAAQNRAAQRAFRQRKEGYIKKLEQQVRDQGQILQSFKATQTENYTLREYVIHLQSRLLDALGEFPQPPPNLNLSQPMQAQQTPSQTTPQQRQQPLPSQNPPATSSAHDPEISSSNNHSVSMPLEAVARAVAGLAAQEELSERRFNRLPSPSPKAEPRQEDAQPSSAVTSMGPSDAKNNLS